MSFALTAVFVGLGRIAGAAAELVDKLPSRNRYELSQDGESLYLNNERYRFVGFSFDGSYTTPAGEKTVFGKHMGYVANDRAYSVRRLKSVGDDYLALCGVGDSVEVYVHAAG